MNKLARATRKHLDSQQSSDLSPFIDFKFDEFRDKPAEELQSLFRTKHILVHGVPYTKMSFDRKGLSTLGGWNEPRTFQGKIYVANTSFMIYGHRFVY